MNKIFVILGLFMFIGAGCAGPIPSTMDLISKNDEPNPTESIVTKATEDNNESDTAENKPSTILDYYQILPAEYIDHQYFYPEVRMDHIDVLDEDNYYIRIEPLVQSGGTETGAITLFRKNGQDVIGAEGGITTSLSFRKLHLLTYKDGEWTDITNDAIPWNKIDFDKLRKKVHEGSELEEQGLEADIRSFYFVLPRYGTDLELVETISEEVVMTFRWRNGKFYVK